MASTRVIWFGPVSSMQVRGATVDGVRPDFVSCTGDGSDGHPTCADRADAWKDENGRRLPGLFAKLEIVPDDVERLYLGAFSAGGQVLKRIALHPADRAAITAMLLSDATYTTEWLDQKQGWAMPIEGFVELAADCLTDGRLFLATASSAPNHDHPTGAQSLDGVRVGIEQKTGCSFEDASSDPLWTDLAAPRRAFRLRNVILADFGSAYKHGEHATALAPVLWPRAIASAAAAGRGR